MFRRGHRKAQGVFGVGSIEGVCALKLRHPLRFTRPSFTDSPEGVALASLESLPVEALPSPDS